MHSRMARHGSSGNYHNHSERFNSYAPKKSAVPGSRLRKPKWDIRSLKPFPKNFLDVHPRTANRSPPEVDDFLRQNEVSVDGKDIPRPVQSFEELNIPDFIKQPLYDMKFLRPTAIQAQGWPIAISGRDMVGIAQTGSGKTYSFIVPGVLHITNQPTLNRGEGPIVLVLCPTRELSLQVADVANQFVNTCNIRVCCIYGGAPKGPQLRQLEDGAEIIIATPGRLLDFMESRRVNLGKVTYLVLDEADRMLDMGFEPQIRTIIEFTRPDRQTLMWSATWPREVHALASDFMTNFVKINIGAIDLHANHNITQIVEICEEYEKEQRLICLLEHIMKEEQFKTLIFVETKRKADELTRGMRRDGWPSMSIHGDKKQAEREWVLHEFRSGSSPILIATDVAARGLDITDIRYVINFDYPNGSEDYIHRIGRTARSDKSGTAYTFFTRGNARQASDLIKVLKEARQVVPPQLLDMAERSKTMPGGRRSGRGYQKSEGVYGKDFGGRSSRPSFSSDRRGGGRPPRGGIHRGGWSRSAQNGY